MSYQHLVVEQSDAVMTVTVNRPSVLNALNTATVAELGDVIAAIGADDAVRAVVLTGAGTKAFVAGADIKELAPLTPTVAEQYARRGQTVCDRIERLGKPVIAAVNGYALGGGCEIAMACTVRIAAETARFGQPEVTLGMLPGYGGTQRLPRLVGAGRALELMLTGEAISASEAHRIGLVNRVVPGDALLETARSLATQLAGRAPVAVRYILTAVHEGVGMTLRDGCAREASLFGLAAATNDWREGTTAFLDKRRPRFDGT